MSLLRIEGLRVAAPGGDGPTFPVDGVDLQLPEGGTLGLVGESGCGKSLTALSILRLLPEPALRIVDGHIWFHDVDLRSADDATLRGIRGRRIGMIFQEPATSLNPVLSCGEQIAEMLRLHRKLSSRAAAARAVDLLAEVSIEDPARRACEYPHQLSGGMRQRVMIAMAISCEPQLLIADEPTTALDVTVQASILELLAKLCAERRMGLLHITHDLALIAERAERVAVMYAGRVVEAGSVAQVLARPAHPYTLGLLASRPALAQPRTRLPVIPGRVPLPSERGGGCAFASRCPFRVERCQQEVPPATADSHGHVAACFQRDQVLAAGEWPLHG